VSFATFSATACIRPTNLPRLAFANFTYGLVAASNGTCWGRLHCPFFIVIDGTCATRSLFELVLQATLCQERLLLNP
jgi:hypothetical protein